MDVDWFDIDDVVDYLAAEVIYCDFAPSDSYSTFADFTEYPWWWGANYCLESMSVTENDEEGVPQTTEYPAKAWMKTDDFTGFLDLESDAATALVADGDYDPTTIANWETDLFVAAWEEYTDLTNVLFLRENYI
jgi:hypothetical protein